MPLIENAARPAPKPVAPVAETPVVLRPVNDTPEPLAPPVMGGPTPGLIAGFVQHDDPDAPGYVHLEAETAFVAPASSDPEAVRHDLDMLRAEYDQLRSQLSVYFAELR